MLQFSRYFALAHHPVGADEPVDEVVDQESGKLAAVLASCLTVGYDSQEAAVAYAYARTIAIALGPVAALALPANTNLHRRHHSC